MDRRADRMCHAAPLPYKSPVIANCNLSREDSLPYPLTPDSKAISWNQATWWTAGQLLAEIDARTISMGTVWQTGRSAPRRQGVGRLRGHARIRQGRDSQVRVGTTAVDDRTARRASRRSWRSAARSTAWSWLGDHAKLEGVPLAKGQDPLRNRHRWNAWSWKSKSPKTTCRFVQPGMPTRVRLAAFPLQTFRTEPSNGCTQSRIEGTQQRIRRRTHRDNSRSSPTGYARPCPNCRRRAIAWNLVHKAFTPQLVWLGW